MNLEVSLWWNGGFVSDSHYMKVGEEWHDLGQSGMTDCPEARSKAKEILAKKYPELIGKIDIDSLVFKWDGMMG